jgi:protein involved in polysaccharide export with SLBB domain
VSRDAATDMRSATALVVAVITLALASGCAGLRSKLHLGGRPNTSPAASAGGDSDKPPFDASTYVIGVRDVLSVLVYPSDLPVSGNLVVGPDGKITLAVAGEFVAQGKTKEALSADIAAGFMKAGIKEPQVAVGLVESHSRRYFIQGQVRSPGARDMITPIRVLNALIEAGGFLEFANTKKIMINRGNGAKILTFNFNDVIRGVHTEQNIWVEPDDIIVVN